jgi:hypothetical protein
MIRGYSDWVTTASLNKLQIYKTHCIKEYWRHKVYLNENWEPLKETAQLCRDPYGESILHTEKENWRLRKWSSEDWLT